MRNKAKIFRSKALDIVKSLNKDEFSRLGKFLNSPFFSSNKNLIKLYRALRKYYPGFKDETFTKENLYKNIYGRNKYDDEKLRKLFSDLYKELNKFLIILNLEEDKLIQNRLLLSELSTKNIDSLFQKKFTEANLFLENQEFRHFHFLEKFLLQMEYVDFQLVRGNQHKIAPNIIERADNLIFFFLSDLFGTLRDIETNSTTFGYQPERNLPNAFIDNFNIDNFLKYIEDNNYPNKEFIRIYSFAYIAFKKFEDETHYGKLEEAVFDCWGVLSKIGRLNAISQLINYCVRKLKCGISRFDLNLHQLYKTYLECSLYEFPVYIRDDMFLSITDNFFNHGEIGKVKEFFSGNYKSFNPERRDNLLHYINALIDYGDRKYGDALNNLAHIKTDAFLIKRRMKLLMLKIYYEMGLYDEALANSNNYKKFLLNNKSVPGQGQEGGLKFINYYNELLKIRFEKKDDFAAEEFKKSISRNGVIEEKRWMEEKIKELS